MNQALASPALDDKYAHLRPEAAQVAVSGIDEVAKYGRGRQGLIPLWVGEGDMPTQGFINEAATRSLAAGETFYTDQRGIPELREAVARYVTRHYGLFDGAPFAPRAGRRACRRWWRRNAAARRARRRTGRSAW